MLTTWAKKASSIPRNTSCYNLIQYTGANGDPAFIPAIKTTGELCYINPTPFSAVGTAAIVTDLSSIAQSTGSVGGVAFGSDGTLPTENDYTLGNQLTGFTATVSSVTPVVDTTNYTYGVRWDYTITNNTDEDITIRELGLFCKFYPADTKGAIPSTSTNNRILFMVDRTVVDPPVVIPANTAGVVRYEFAYSVDEEES